MKYSILFSCLLLILSTSGQSTAQEQSNTEQKIKVYLLGTFHFSQTEKNYNVLDAKHQKSIIELCDLVIKQKPDKVFVERQPEFEFRNRLDSLFENYVKEDVLPYKNEIYQVGFRIAKAMKHPKVYQCDHPGLYGKHYRTSEAYAIKHQQTDFLNAEAKGDRHAA